MKIETVYRVPDDYGEGERYEINVNGKCRVDVGRPEPEDATLGRDLNFAFFIVPLMREAWEAGKDGESFVAVGYRLPLEVTEETDEE